MRRIGSLAALCALAGGACAGAPHPITDCEPRDHIEPICGLSNPEDLVAIPGSDWLLVSQMSGRRRPVGSLAALRPGDGRIAPLFPPSSDAGAQPPPASGDWGDPLCPGPPDPGRFSPHGIDLASLPARPPVLLAVNHGEREAVELFELDAAGDPPGLRWRGCVRLPARVVANDVAALPDGGFVTTKMVDSQTGPASWWSGLRMLLGLDTGLVLEWRPGAGWRALAGSAANGPNGIAVSPDGSAVYFAAYGSRRIVRVDRLAGNPVRSELLPFKPDNLTWTPGGRLLVAGQRGSLLEIARCFELEAGTCGIAYGVAELDPETLEVTLLLEQEGRGAMGAATVALARDGTVYLGTFAGDRVARFAFPRL